MKHLFDLEALLPLGRQAVKAGDIGRLFFTKLDAMVGVIAAHIEQEELDTETMVARTAPIARVSKASAEKMLRMLGGGDPALHLWKWTRQGTIVFNP